MAEGLCEICSVGGGFFGDFGRFGHHNGCPRFPDAAILEVRRLDAEVARLKEMYRSACDRIVGQSELLSRRAERPGV